MAVTDYGRLKCNENWDVEGTKWGSGALKEKVPVPNSVAAHGNLRICHNKRFLHRSVDVQLELETDLSLRYNKLMVVPSFLCRWCLFLKCPRLW